LLGSVDGSISSNEGNEWKFDIVLKDYTSLVTFLSIMSKMDSA